MTDNANVGKVTLAPDVLLTIARMAALGVEGVSRMATFKNNMNRLLRRTEVEGVDVEVEDDIVYVELYLILKNDVNVREVSRNVQMHVTRAISEMVGLEVGHVNVHIEDIEYPVEADQSKEA
jgi:uncharacterized alkaline shock family protein YloU